MSTSVKYTCDACAKEISAKEEREVPFHIEVEHRTPPARGSMFAFWDTAATKLHACSKKCAAGLLREHANKLDPAHPVPETPKKGLFR